MIQPSAVCALRGTGPVSACPEPAQWVASVVTGVAATDVASKTT
jgi:hypothetical protein